MDNFRTKAVSAVVSESNLRKLKTIEEWKVFIEANLGTAGDQAAASVRPFHGCRRIWTRKGNVNDLNLNPKRELFQAINH